MPLHAALCRYEGVTASIDEVMRAGQRLASALSTTSGFVSFAILDAGDGVLISVTAFDDRSSLEAAQQLTVRSVVEHLSASLPRPAHVIDGEIIVQRGM